MNTETWCSMCWFQEHEARKTPYPGCACCADNHGIVVIDGEVVDPVGLTEATT